MYEKIINIKFLNFSSFLKRFLIVSLSIILCVNTVCKPREVKAAAIVPVATTIVKVCGVIAAVTGAAIGVHEVASWFFDNKDMDEDEVVDYFNKNVSVDGDGNYTFTDDAQLTINQMLEDYDKAVTMMYRYPYRPDCLDGAWFPNKAFYTAFVDMVKQHPDYYFVVGTNYGNSSITIYAFKSDDALACINSNFNLIYAKCDVYNSDWLQSVKGYYMTMEAANKIYAYKVAGQAGSERLEFTSFDDVLSAQDYLVDFNIPQANCIRQDNIKWSLPNWNRDNAPFLVSAHEGAVNCYKSVADMKKDLDSQVVGKYTSDYTGQPNYNITTSEVNNVINNYYSDDSGGGSGSGGGSSGSDDSGGGSSILDGFGKVFGAVGKLIDTIFGFILDIFSKLIDNVTKILDMFVGTLKKLVDLVPSGFNEFLAALFPYIPEEWKTIIEAMLLVSVLGVVIAVFRR